MSKIIKLSTGKYRVQIYDHLGKRHRITFARKSEAEDFIRKIEFQKHQQQQIERRLIKARVPIDQAIADFWVDKTTIRNKTRQKYKYEILQFESFCKGLGINYIDEFSRKHADQFKQRLLDSEAAPKTVNSYLSRLRAIFSEQVNRDNIVRNPASHIKNISLTAKTLLQKENEYYTEQEVKAFFQQEIDLIYRFAFIGLYLTGMRFEELANLTWERVDMEKRMLCIRSTERFITKTPSAERDVAMSNKLYKMIHEKCSNHFSEYVFPSKNGAKLKERTLLSVCKRTAKKAGIMKNSTLHMFRHTFNSLLAQYGISYEVREYLLGHKPKGSLTSHYTKLDPTKYHSTISLLDKITE